LDAAAHMYTYGLDQLIGLLFWERQREIRMLRRASDARARNSNPWRSLRAIVDSGVAYVLRLFGHLSHAVHGRAT
jgi:hypothetical protein